MALRSVLCLFRVLITLLIGGVASPLFAQPEAQPPAQDVTYWLGRRTGYEIQFDIPVPADAVAVILNKEKAPNREDDTRPRYRTFTRMLSGKNIVLHATELAWETPKLNEGSLTWAVDAGLGADWRQCDTANPLWAPFAAGLKALSVDNDGWSVAKVVVAEGRGKTAPTMRLNLDGTIGKPTPGQMALWKLSDLNGKNALSAEEMTQVRGYLLAVANAGRANPEYRKQSGCKTALDLPKNLKPLALNDALNKAAQIQAEYCARIKETTHDNDDSAYATMDLRLKSVGVDKVAYEAAGGGALQDYPTNWMKSETHYRPWWNLDEQVVTIVGFGIARGDNGVWYLVAVLAE